LAVLDDPAEIAELPLDRPEEIVETIRAGVAGPTRDLSNWFEDVVVPAYLEDLRTVGEPDEVPTSSSRTSRTSRPAGSPDYRRADEPPAGRGPVPGPGFGAEENEDPTRILPASGGSSQSELPNPFGGAGRDDDVDDPPPGDDDDDDLPPRARR